MLGQLVYCLTFTHASIVSGPPMVLGLREAYCAVEPLKLRPPDPPPTKLAPENWVAAASPERELLAVPLKP